MTTPHYGVSRLVHDGTIYDAMNPTAPDLPFYLRRCAEAAGPVLELCSGTGRLTIPIAQAGYDVTGLDQEPSMLARARAKASAAGLDIPFVEEDMRSFALARRFDLIFIPFNSLQNTYTRQDVESIFTCVKRHLTPRGRLVFDVFNPDFRLMLERSDGPHEQFRGAMPDGRELVVLERCLYDAAGQVNRVTWTFRIGEDASDHGLDMRCYYPLELEALLHYNGWQIESLFGSFDERPFESASPKQIVVCTAR